MSVKEPNTANSNIHIAIFNKSPIKFPNDCLFEFNEGKDLKHGTVLVFQKDGLLFAELKYENDMLNGISHFYEKGVVDKSITYVNNVIDGWAIEKGIEKYYRNGTAISQLLKHPSLPNYMNEVDAKTRKIIRCCRFDENHKPFGVGYIYKNGKIHKMVIYGSNNVEVILREFDGSEMTEYDMNGNILYKGEYKMDDRMEFSRSGEGMEYANQKVVFIGQYVNNIRQGEGRTIVNGKARFIGEWKHGVPHGHGVLYNENHQPVWSGEWEQGRGYLNEYEWYDYQSGEKQSEGYCFGLCKKKRKPVTLLPEEPVSSYCPPPPPEMDLLNIHVGIRGSSLNTLPKNVKIITIQEGSCNKIKKELVLSNFLQLQHLHIQADSLKNLKSFTVKQCPALTTIETADNLRNSWDNPGSCLEKVPTIVISSPFHSVLFTRPSFLDHPHDRKSFLSQDNLLHFIQFDLIQFIDQIFLNSHTFTSLTSH